MELTKTISELPLAVLVLAVMLLIWAGKEYWEARKKNDEKHDFVLQQNTLALVELKSELKGLTQTVQHWVRRQEKLEEDIDALHAKQRSNGKP